MRIDDVEHALRGWVMIAAGGERQADSNERASALTPLQPAFAAQVLQPGGEVFQAVTVALGGFVEALPIVGDVNFEGAFGHDHGEFDFGGIGVAHHVVQRLLHC